MSGAGLFELIQLGKESERKDLHHPSSRQRLKHTSPSPPRGGRAAFGKGEKENEIAAIGQHVTLRRQPSSHIPIPKERRISRTRGRVRRDKGGDYDEGEWKEVGWAGMMLLKYINEPYIYIYVCIYDHPYLYFSNVSKWRTRTVLFFLFLFFLFSPFRGNLIFFSPSASVPTPPPPHLSAQSIPNLKVNTQQAQSNPLILQPLPFPHSLSFSFLPTNNPLPSPSFEPQDPLISLPSLLTPPSHPHSLSLSLSLSASQLLLTPPVSPISPAAEAPTHEKHNEDEDSVGDEGFVRNRPKPPPPPPR